MHIETTLNQKQQFFCKLYVSKEFFGNGVQSYMEAYGTKNYNAAKVSAHELLTNPNILKEIDSLLDKEGFNNSFVDKQLLFVIRQNENFPAKVQAIREYNKIKKRYDGLDNGGKIIVNVLGYSNAN